MFATRADRGQAHIHDVLVLQDLLGRAPQHAEVFNHTLHAEKKQIDHTREGE